MITSIQNNVVTPQKVAFRGAEQVVKKGQTIAEQRLRDMYGKNSGWIFKTAIKNTFKECIAVSYVKFVKACNYVKNITKNL